MTKPFDLSDLVARLKDKGLVLAEQDAKLVTNCVFDWLDASMAVEANQLFKMAIPVIEILRPMAIAAEDNIDGIKGN
jgi:hypothetical protein